MYLNEVTLFLILGKLMYLYLFRDGYQFLKSESLCRRILGP
jgi:hypothetical protein